MRVEVVAVGTELLLGQIVDTNSSWIGQQLAAVGLDSHYQTKVGDNPERIREVLQHALRRSDAVICCGGLGPTQDDLTREVIADLLGVELVPDEAIADRIRSMFASRGREMPANNLRQAMVPEGCTTLPQQPGTAPGLRCPIEIDGVEKIIYAVPGVPYEMREMVEGSVLGDLVARSGEPAVIRSRVLRTWGTSESGLAEMLAERITELDGIGNPTLAFLASGVEGIKVRITAKAPHEDAAVDALDAEERVLLPLIGHLVFARDDVNMELVVVQLLTRHGLTLAAAESLTGGFVASRLSVAAHGHDVWRGGVVVAAPVEMDEDHGRGEQAAVGLAEEARRQFAADIGLAVHGAPGSGVVHLAIASDDGALGSTLRVPGDSERTRQFSAITVLDILRRVLLERA
jgi:nicotinamide-nucleotide amidase